MHLITTQYNLFSETKPFLPILFLTKRKMMYYAHAPLQDTALIVLFFMVRGLEVDWSTLITEARGLALQ